MKLFYPGLVFTGFSFFVLLGFSAAAYPGVRGGVILLVLIAIAYLSFAIAMNGRVLRLNSYAGIDGAAFQSYVVAIACLLMLIAALLCGVYAVVGG